MANTSIPVSDTKTPTSSVPDWLTRLRDQRDRFMGFAFASSDLLIETDLNGVIRFTAGAVQSMTGLSPKQLNGKKITQLFDVGDQAVVRQLIDAEFSGRRWGPISMEMRTPAFSHGRQVMVCAVRPRPDRDITSFTITPTALAGGMSISASQRDEETGLMTRQAFVDNAAIALSAASIVRDQLTISAITIRWVNDASEDNELFGKDARVVSIDAMLSTLRLYAINGLLCQVSEVKYLLVHVPPSQGGRSLDILQSVVDNTQRQRIATIEVNEIAVPGPMPAEEFMDALRYTISQLALRRDWNLAFEDLGEALEHKIAEAVSRVTWFKRALLNRDIAVVAQAIVDFENRDVHHYEVNVRFHGDESPAALITFAEEIGIIHELDYIVAELTLAHLNGPKATQNKIGLAVNLSGNSLLRDDMVPRLIALMGGGLANSSRVMFELTESFKISDLPAANEAIQKLRRKGYRVCLDDLDAGAASLEYMEAFEVDFIKLDGHSIHRGMESHRHALVVESLVNLSRRLRAEVIAEMIETEEQAVWAASIGAKYGQGYLFARPIPIEHVSGRVLQAKK